MGSSSSKFKKYLQHGDEYAAMQVYQNSGELRRSLQPNCSYGDHHHHNTPMHYAAKHGMKHLIRAFLNDLGGNPNIRNARGQTSLHCVCQISHQKSPSAVERRSYSVILLLSWRGPLLPSGERERVEVGAKDVKGNTALHYAASNGLRKCVEYLVAHGADLCSENLERLTACDLALRENHHDIATFLESKMVCTPEDLRSSTEATMSASGSLGRNSFEGQLLTSDADSHSGLLRTQDLQEAKDQIIVEVADTLGVPLYNAENLLRHSEWSRDSVLEKWRVGEQPLMDTTTSTSRLSEAQQQQSVAASAATAPQPPPPALPYPDLLHPNSALLTTTSGGGSGGGGAGNGNRPKIYSENSFIVDEQLAEDECLCEVCCDLIEANKGLLNEIDESMSCKHKVCANCWKLHLATKCQQPSSSQISCPASDCTISIPIILMEKYLGSQYDYEENAIDKKCPGCSKLVTFVPDSKSLNSRDGKSSLKISHSVDCGNGHYFCWECGKLQGHAPVSCGLWSKWQEKCTAMDSSGFFAWLNSNAKPCPKCGQTMEKRDGCNKVQCAKCTYECCWLCLQGWSKHPMCNRFVETGNEDLRFLHFYLRYKNHSNSRAMEDKVIKNEINSNNCYCPRRHSMFASEATASMVASVRSKFSEEAAWELKKSRSILCASYVYGYFHLDEHQGTKSLFALMQYELEDITEKLSELLQRQVHLRTTKRKVQQASQYCLQKRTDFLKAIYSGLQWKDPWMNRNWGGNFNTLGHRSSKAKSSSSSKEDRQIWTKTLSYPNKKCQRPGCQNSCSNVRSSVKNFCSPQCSQIMNLSSSSASSSKPDLRPRRVFTELHNTLPRSSKSEDDLLSRGPKLVQSCISPPPPPVKEKQNNNNNTFDDKKVKAAGYRPLINDGGSSTSEDTLKNVITTATTSEAATAASVVTTTSQRKTRPKFVRQMSFDLADTDTETNLPADNSGRSTTTATSAAVTASRNNLESSSKGHNKQHPLHTDATKQQPSQPNLANNSDKMAKSDAITAVEATELNDDENNHNKEDDDDDTNSNKKRSRPALTIKIQNSSFHDQDQENEEDLASELEKSPRLYISGVNISRSPGDSSAASSLSPRWLNTSNTNRNRSASLVVPPVIRRKPSTACGGSPGSKSLHLSPLSKNTTTAGMIHATKSQTMFTFPDPSGGGGTVPGGTKDSGSGGTGTGSGGTTTDSRFSSILHVHERHLSTEDFHEALFFEKSPKSGQNKKRPRKTRKTSSNIKNELTVTQI